MASHHEGILVSVHRLKSDATVDLHRGHTFPDFSTTMLPITKEQ